MGQCPRMKNALTFWEGGPTPISDMNTVVGRHVTRHRCGVLPLCPGHRSAMSLPISDDAAPERSLDFLWFNNSTERPALIGLVPCQLFKRSPFKVFQGHSTLLKAIRGFLKKYFFCFMNGTCHSVWPVKRSQAPVKGSQARSSSVKQFGGKKRLFIFMHLCPNFQPSTNSGLLGPVPVPTHRMETILLLQSKLCASVAEFVFIREIRIKMPR